MENIGWLVLLCVTSALLQGVTGIGFSMMVMSMGVFLCPYSFTMNVNRILGVMISCYSWYHWRKNVKWEAALPIIAASLLFNAAGVNILARLNEEVLKKALGIVLLMVVGVGMYVQRRKLHITVRFWKGLLFGAAAGFFCGLFGIMGPVLAIYYVNVTENMEEYRGTLNLHFTILNLWNVLCHGVKSGYTTTELATCVIGGVGVLLATYVTFRWKIIRNRKIVEKGIWILTTILAFSMLLN